MITFSAGVFCVVSSSSESESSELDLPSTLTGGTLLGLFCLKLFNNSSKLGKPFGKFT